MTSQTTTPSRPRVGDWTRKIDAGEKVSGRFAFASDLEVDGMLFGCAARSEQPHARIIDIDVSEAIAMEGVHAVLLAEDVPGAPNHGIELRDQPVLAKDLVRYRGEPLALVAAVDRATARRAASAVKVTYEPLPVIDDPELALTSEPLHHHDLRHDDWCEDDRPNVVRTVRVVHGDPEAEGDVVVTGTYEVGRQDPAFLGPEAGLAIPDGSGGIDIHVPTQWLHQDLPQVVACLGLTEAQVRIHLAGVGGAFGGREDLSGQIHAAMLALHTGRPVKFMYLRDESFVGHVHRHPAKIWAEHRATRDGKLVNVRMRLLLDGGAYASGSPAVTFNAATMPVGPYYVPNAHLEATTVYTNNPPAGAMRGFGVVQSCYAAESQMDALAEALGMDPIELRLANVLEPGDLLPTGEPVFGPLPVAEVIRRCAALEPPAAEDLPRDPIRLPGGTGNTTHGEGIKRGVGFAVTFKNCCYSGGYDDYSTSRVRLVAEENGELVAEVHSAAVEFGQGITNVLTQVAYSELAVDRVVIGPASTRLGSSGSTSASRQTWMSTGALRLCTDAVNKELADRGGSLLPGEVIDVERTYHHAETSPLDPVTGQVTGERSHVGFACAAMKVVVEVDEDLGLVRVVWIGTSQDVGKAINPLAVEGQIEGGIAQGLGLALMEEIVVTQGVIKNASFTDYLIPTMLDMPPVTIDLLEIPNPEAPYGLKGVGEPPTVVATGAVASAVRNATGLRLPRVPIRPQDIALPVHDA